MTIAEAAKILDMSPNDLRGWAQTSKGCPFVVITREAKGRGKRNTYRVDADRLKLWKEGKI